MERDIERKDKKPHFISPRLLEALGGIREETAVGPLIDRGEFVWGVEGVEDRKKGEGLFRHVLLVSRVAYALAKELKEKRPGQYGDLDMRSVVEIALLHDVVKLYAQDREALSDEQKKAASVRKDLKEIDAETEEVGASWLKELGFPERVIEGTKDHFPERVINDPYWKIGVVADSLVGQRVMPLEDRLRDVKTRWIDEKIAAGEPPRVDPAAFERARGTIEAVARELFAAIGTTDEAFIEKHKLNDPESATRWERFLTGTRERAREDRAKGLVEKSSTLLSGKGRADDPDSN